MILHLKLGVTELSKLGSYTNHFSYYPTIIHYHTYIGGLASQGCLPLAKWAVLKTRNLMNSISSLLVKNGIPKLDYDNPQYIGYVHAWWVEGMSRGHELIIELDLSFTIN